MTSNVITFAILFLLVAMLICAPVPLIVFGFRGFERARYARGGAMLSVGAAILAGWVWLFVWILDATGPGHDGVLAQGTSPQGLEYCVVQSWTGTRVEPYQVSFYIRYPSGAWHWNYLEHEDLAWRSARVEFAGNVAMVFRNDAPFQNVPVPAGIDPESIDPEERSYDCPASGLI